MVFALHLKHEYGHTRQMKELGIINYVGLVAFPSIVNNLASRNNEYLYDLYYCMPWERTADYLGNVSGREFKYQRSKSLYNDPKWIEYCLEHFGGKK